MTFPHDFTLTPPDGPPRLIRFITADKLGVEYYLAKLDAENNVLTINQTEFDTLDDLQKQQVITTRLAIVLPRYNSAWRV